GIGDSTPEVKLDVAGAIRPGDTAVACGASIYGAIRYASGDMLEMCSSITNDWETIGTSGGGGGGSGSLWTNNTSYITRGNFNVLNIGAALPAGLAGAGARAFWYPDKWAFRAGAVSGTQWDDANIGNYSAAFGLDNTVSGAYAFSAGRLNTASNTQSMALGYGVTSSGDSSLATGSLTSATGSYSTAMGLKATASGLRSFAFGLGDPAANPVVSGAGSFGIFMGDQSGVNINTANLMALMGGKLIIDPDTTSAANTVPSGSLTVDVEGGVGAMQYCDEDGLNCFTAYDISSGSVGVPGNDRELIFNSGGSLWTDVNLVFTSAGRFG
ncbi:MAG: hypothetical protein HYU57_03820, partial [Micavibrio aeruginosavorus]|nr:hypothetical protein [Micavibrio aeruginosavorus]